MFSDGPHSLTYLGASSKTQSRAVEVHEGPKGRWKTLLWASL